jgi:Mrp family chromosome partitioning ATPase
MPTLPLTLFPRRAGAVRSIDDATALGLPVLGSISEYKPGSGAPLPDEAFPEALGAFRRLTEVVRAADYRVRGNAIVVTSVEAGAGKSTIAKNLATLLARSGSRVVLVDADVNRVVRRRPGDGTSSSGFAGLLVNQLMRPSNALVHTMDIRLKILPAGSTNGPAEALLLSSRLARVVDGLCGLADYVIFDVAPVSASLPNLTRLSDVTLVVLRSGSTSRKRASRAVATLRPANAGLLGFVLNRAAVVISARGSEAEVPEAEIALPAPEERLEISVDDLLANLAGTLRLIRDIRRAGEAEDGAEDDEEDSELVTMER